MAVLPRRAAVPRVIWAREVVTLLDGNVQTRFREQQDVAPASAIRSRAQPLHPPVELDQVGPRMRCQVFLNRYQPMPTEDLVLHRRLSGRRRNPREDQVERVLHLRHWLAGFVRGVKRARKRPHILPPSRWTFPVAGYAGIGTGRAISQVDVGDRALVCERSLVILFRSEERRV